MKKKIILAMTLICSIFAVTACGTGEEGNNNETSTTPKADEKKVVSWEFEWTAPEAFTSEDGSLYVTADYPTDSSNITYSYTEKDPQGLEFTPEEYEQLLESTYDGMGLEVDVKINKFEAVDNNGCEGLVIECEYEMAGVMLSQVQYAYQAGDAVYTVCYTAVGDTWVETFEENAKTIKLIPVYE